MQPVSPIMVSLIGALASSTALTPPASPITIALAETPVTASTTTTTPFETASGTLTPPADCDVVVVFGWRCGSSLRTNSAPTATFATVAGFTEVADASDLNGDGAGNGIRATLWVGRATGSPGSGVVTCATSASTYQQILAVFWVEHATGAASAIIEAMTSTGTTIAGSWSPSTPAHGVGVALMVQQGTNDTPAFSNDPVMVTGQPADIGQMGTALGVYTGVPAGTQTVSGGQSARSRVMAAAHWPGVAA